MVSCAVSSAATLSPSWEVIFDLAFSWCLVLCSCCAVMCFLDFWNQNESVRVSSGCWYSDHRDFVIYFKVVFEDVLRWAYSYCCLVSVSNPMWFHIHPLLRNETLLLTCQHMFFDMGQSNAGRIEERMDRGGKKRQQGRESGREDLGSPPVAEINNILFSSVLDIFVATL